MKLEEFLAIVRMHAIHQCLSVLYWDVGDFEWAGSTAGVGSYSSSNMSDERLAFCWNSHAVIGAAWDKYTADVIVDQLPAELGLMIPEPSEPWTQVVWLHGELWYTASRGDGTRVIDGPLDRRNPLSPFFLPPNLAAAAWNWSEPEDPVEVSEAAVEIARLPPGTTVDSRLANVFAGTSDRHRIAERQLADMGLVIRLDSSGGLEP